MTTELKKAVDTAANACKSLLKSHVRQYTRASGTVVQEHDDSRQAAEKATANANSNEGDIHHPAHAMNASSQHVEAATAHIHAMHAAREHGGGNAGITDHFYAASKHLSRASGLEQFHRENSGRAAHAASARADWMSEEAKQQSAKHGNKPHDSESLNHLTSIHELAAEEHQRAAAAYRSHLPNSADRNATNDMVKYHTNKAKHHGKKMQEYSQIAIKASDEAHKASKKAYASSSKADHAAAAKAHDRAAHLDYDSEGAENHRDLADRHRAAANSKWSKVDPSEHNGTVKFDNRTGATKKTKTWTNR